MPVNDDAETVRSILKRKKGSIRTAPMEPGSPPWHEILEETWEEVKEKAPRRVRGYKTFRKLL